MPWRGPNEAGEFPTLGYDVGEWIESHIVIPDGYRRGEAYVLTDEMWRFLLRFYRLRPDATFTDALVYFGGQLRRSQKWGKDPFGAAIILAEALGPARFDGWDAAGEPVGAPYPTPYIPCLGVSEEQTDNTYKPLLTMIREGPLADLPGMDAGETRTELPNGGTIEPVTSSPKSRLGQRMTFATLTETHLWTPSSGGRKLAAAVKRNIAGMDGRWLELTNAWDPSEDSEAQATGDGKEPGVLVDTTDPKRVEDLSEDDPLRRELLRQYGDSARERGGWVNLDRIIAEVRSPRVTEADARRFFLNEIVMGESDFVDPTVWDALQGPKDLKAKQKIALGFDGSRSDDSTALIACRLEDCRLFELGVWEREPDAPPTWTVPRTEVDERVQAAFDAYQVAAMFCDPFKWESYVDLWAGRWPKQAHPFFGGVLEEPTNSESRFDRDVRLFLHAVKDRSLSHDGSERLSRHAKNAAIAKGKRRAAHDDDGDDTLSRYYLRVVKKRTGKIDAAVAAVLAVAARGYAVEHGALAEQAPFFAAARR